MEIKTIKNVTDLLSEINRRNNIKSISDFALFRGQESDWPLIPKIGRIVLRNLDFRVGELEMLSDFKRLSTPHLNRIPQSEIEWLALAQHHGMATRLLDWTTNPLTALWFAVNKPPRDEADGVLWFFDVPEEFVIKAEDSKSIDPFEDHITVVVQPFLASNRIVAQNGWFTLHLFSKEQARFFKFEDNPKYKKQLFKFSIPYESFSDIRNELDRLGVNRMSLFPDIDGVANYSEWLNSVLSDEHPKQTGDNR